MRSSGTPSCQQIGTGPVAFMDQFDHRNWMHQWSRHIPRADLVIWFPPVIHLISSPIIGAYILQLKISTQVPGWLRGLVVAMSSTGTGDWGDWLKSHGDFHGISSKEAHRRKSLDPPSRKNGLMRSLTRGALGLSFMGLSVFFTMAITCTKWDIT